jgi:tight adherence protein B
MVDRVTSTPLVGGLLGAGIGLGLFVALAGWCGLLDRPRRPRRVYPVDQLTLRIALALVGLSLAGWWTRWPTAMIACAALGWLVPSFLGLRARRRRQLARSEAVAVWAEMLRDLLVSNAGLHEAIGKSARVAPLAIRDEVKALYIRTQRGELGPALTRFAAEIDDGIADTVVTALQIADQRAVADLGEMLSAVAASTRDNVAMQLRINAARARVYRTAQLIAVVVAFFVGLIVMINRNYMEPFGTAAGQVVLAVVAGLIGVAIWGMVVLSRPVRSPRLLRVGTGPHREAAR